MKSIEEIVKVVVMFFAILGEMGKQMFLCAVTDSEKWEAIQDKKLSDELRVGLEAEKEGME